MFYLWLYLATLAMHKGIANPKENYSNDGKNKSPKEDLGGVNGSVIGILDEGGVERIQNNPEKHQKDNKPEEHKSEPAKAEAMLVLILIAMSVMIVVLRGNSTNLSGLNLGHLVSAGRSKRTERRLSLGHFYLFPKNKKRNYS